MLVLAIVGLSIHDVWLVASGSLDLSRHLPGVGQLDCLMWAGILRYAKQQGFLDKPTSNNWARPRNLN